MRTFVFGDIHGSFKELNELLEYIFTSEGFNPTEDKLLFIGDYVDRGFQSKQVIDKLISLKDQFPETTFLRGNHEDMFLSFLGLGGAYGSMFIHNGGFPTLASYCGEDLPTAEEFSAMSREDKLVFKDKLHDYDVRDLVSNIPESHKEFLKNTLLYLDTPDILFVHAGVRPGATLEQADSFDFLWVQDNRDRYFSQIKHKPWHKMLVHGHTPVPPDEVKKHMKANRINVDTGFVYGGRLTVLVIEEGKEADQWKIIQNTGEKILIRFS